MAQQRRHQSRRRRRGRFSGLYRLLSVLAAAAAIAVACVVFFRVNEVTVAGNSRYTAEEIIAAYNAVTRQDVMALAEEIFRWDQVSLSAVGQVRSVEEYKELLLG